jgi:hypothetical protein
MVTVRVIDSTQPGSLEKWGVAYNYLRLRLTRELDSIHPNTFNVEPIITRWATTTDVSEAVRAKNILAVIVQRGQQGLVASLAHAAGSKSNASVKIDNVVNGSGTARGVTFGALAIAGTTELTSWDMDDNPISKMHQHQQNSYFLSNVLVHEVGHALHSLSSHRVDPGAVDHKTQGVMQAGLPNDGVQRSYMEAFRKDIRRVLISGRR